MPEETKMGLNQKVSSEGHFICCSCEGSNTLLSDLDGKAWRVLSQESTGSSMLDLPWLLTSCSLSNNKLLVFLVLH